MKVILLSSLASCIFGQPSMVYIINRHGVIQTRDTTTYEGGPLLLNTSYDRLYQKGTVIRSLYPNLLSSTYKTNDIRFNSSAWERSITTTYGIITGLYSNQNNFTSNIPVYSTPWENDYTLYNYDKCPNYNTALNNLFASAEFQNKMIYYSNLTKSLNLIVNPANPITLQNIYTTWNMYWLSINSPESGQVMPPISSQLYETLTEATNYVETMKMSVQVAGTYFGSTLLNAIKYRTDMFIRGNTVFGRKMILSTSHYPNILGLFASLGYTGSKAQAIPDYNAMVVFELYNNSGKWSLQLKFYDGDWYSFGALYPIGLGNCIDGISGCSYDYNTFWNTYKVKNITEFCMDCGSTLPMCVGSIVSNNAQLLESAVNYITNNTYVLKNESSVITKILNSNDTNTIKAVVSTLIAMSFVTILMNLYICIKMSYSSGFTRIHDPKSVSVINL
jgi:hypothetical protein